MRKYLSQAELTERGHGSRTKLWRRSRDPDDPFPAPYELGQNSIGWALGENVYAGYRLFGFLGLGVTGSGCRLGHRLIALR